MFSNTNITCRKQYVNKQKIKNELNRGFNSFFIWCFMRGSPAQPPSIKIFVFMGGGVAPLDLCYCHAHHRHTSLLLSALLYKGLRSHARGGQTIHRIVCFSARPTPRTSTKCKQTLKVLMFACIYM